ncbi:HAMP domain-containing histidine kinase [Bariatricus massiliensis]|uniref:histidine kinase n=1 Tax=Bariatricus massiliensis TaxID=1745713 RepID=A0ABS8DG38_9FIRM|nr:HAMP domain-containing sensor histidine kinase [Bariatricus massiliensis]MCB7304059.1 HAMP domain-containing histidine kinase [Bariatricus massiliensis]MCB7374510.1 HAMP domain-containing histidine kinase [Bariatricus massiliensis]MCB7387169.1 HAMP domain-containing histidine kinase [Bariatricus massiliensis]MCB7411331.1 HAMP domain-containing histidine kinase [Bariatricus massiliensis]MCQ5252724.1 HAMP domain-containing histidine kinase [Bariatricus massiliensis]
MRYKIQVRHVTGILVGAASGKFVYDEMDLLARYLKMKGIYSDTDGLRFFGGLLALAVFGVVCFLFSKYGKNGLGNYLLLSVVVSLAVVIALVFLSGFAIQVPAVQKAVREMTEQQGLLISGILYIIFVVLIFIFVFSFRFLVKSKVNYIQYITSEVRQIEKNGFGRQIKVKYQDELAELSLGINNMSLALKEKQDREKEQEEQKNRLIADISHDLRTPLTSIIGYTELMKEDGFSDKEKCGQYLEVIDRRLGNMKTMVDQLFEYTRLTQSDYHLNLQPVKLNKLLDYINFEYGSILKNMDFKWVMEVEFQDTVILADEERFMRAMGNLLDNAKKYSRPQTEIRLDGRKRKDFVQIELSNELEDPDKIDTTCIFERFYKGNQARLSEEGTGLGLPIVKKIIELHGGTIGVKTLDRRIVFTVEMPLYKKESAR